MACLKNPRYLAVLSLPLLLTSLTTAVFAQSSGAQTPILNLSNSAPTKISLKFKPPNRGAPPSTAGGASRGACALGNKEITPLVPTNKLGLTFASHPSFFLFVPASPAKSVELLLLTDDDTQVVYQTTFALPQSPGIVRFNLPQSAPALEVGKQYHWYLTVNCDPNRGPSGNPSVEGWIERTEPQAALTKALAKAAPNVRAQLYADAGIWHETLTALADLQHQYPTNSKVINDWRELLRSVGLEAIATEPIIDCCNATNSSNATGKL